MVFSCEFSEISKNTFSYRTPPLAASENRIKQYEAKDTGVLKTVTITRCCKIRKDKELSYLHAKMQSYYTVLSSS